jgi:hypothetical protein
MAVLRWQLDEADDIGVVSLSLHLDGRSVRALLRGKFHGQLPPAVLNEPGRLADMVGFGWSGLVAVSPRLRDGLRGLTGAVFRDLPVVDPAFAGYSVLTVTGVCGRVDYSRSTEVGRLGEFKELRGLVVDREDVLTDFAVPTNRETVLITDSAAQAIRSGGYSNVMLTNMSDIQFHVGERMITGPDQ